ncbi:MAG: 23S rRNA (pseudouridine(1915)-N(3))-methyltransferase RlmH [Hyphomonas sp.]
MRILIVAVGRMKTGPERELVDEYVKRAKPLARQLGYREITEVEVASGGSLEAEAGRLSDKIPAGATVFRLDEFGKAQNSVAFSQTLTKLKDQGAPELVFLIGGAAGYGQSVRDAYPQTMALGPQTWPHKFVRVMLAEQIYRALSIEANTPYHKA